MGYCYWNAFRKILCFIFIAIGTESALIAALPPEAQKILNTLPEKKITLKLVVKKAILSSDSFRIVKSDLLTLTVASLQAKGILNPNVYVQFSRMDDQREAQSPFSPSRMRATKYELGLSKYFSTGTSLATEISHGSTTLDFTQQIVPPFFETAGSVSITQKLWKDGLGFGTRRALEAGLLQSRVNLLAFDETVETWMQDLIGIFYIAWGAQAQAKVESTNLKRSEKLLRITRLKIRRGTAEEPDLLAVQSSKLLAEVRRSQATQELNTRWRQLITALKLPDKWLSINPEDVPIELDSPENQSLRLCGPQNKIRTPPKENTSLRKANLSSKVAKLNEERSKNALSPDVELSFSFLGNGINTERGQSFDESLRLDHPGWIAGAKISLPLGNSTEEANARIAIANQIKADANDSIARSQLRLDWLNACTELHRLTQSHQQIKSAWEKQKRRADLEEKRFAVGRSNTITVINAENDAATAESNLYQSEIAKRQAAWQVAKLAGKYLGYLESIGLRDLRKIGEKFAQ